MNLESDRMTGRSMKIIETQFALTSAGLTLLSVVADLSLMFLMRNLEYLIGEIGGMMFDRVNIREASALCPLVVWEVWGIPHVFRSAWASDEAAGKTASPGTSNRLDRLAPTAGSLYFCAFVVDPPGVAELKENRILAGKP